MKRFVEGVERGQGTEPTLAGRRVDLGVLVILPTWNVIDTLARRCDVALDGAAGGAVGDRGSLQTLSAPPQPGRHEFTAPQPPTRRLGCFLLGDVVE